MVTQIMSRNERRMDKKQALLLLVLVLAVALVSFALGVMVGRVGGRSKSAENPASPGRLPVAQAPPVESAGSPPASAAPAADHLTFYDALPKGEQPPLGSGINLPPEAAAPKTPPAAAKSATPAVPAATPALPAASPPKAAAHFPETVKPSVSPAAGKTIEIARTADAPKLPPVPKAAEAQKTPAERPVSSAPSAVKGTFVIQAASYPDAAGARKLRDRLAGRGFGAYIEEADLGSKGTWHRVLVGPYESDQAAAAAASRLKADEKVSGIVRRK